jgi:hypothetical protein
MEKPMQNSDVWQFCHGNRKLKIAHAVTEAMAQSTFVPSFISIEAFFIVS